MRRLLLLAAIVGLAVAGTVWLADRPGDVTIRWQGWRIDTTVPVLLAAVAALYAALHLIGRVLGLVLGAPGRLLSLRRRRRERQGYEALTGGLAAAASGDVKRAGRLARKADKLLNNPAVTGLLSAQAAQLSGDEAAQAERFRAMTARRDTAFLGHKGLAELALKAGDRETARAEADTAFGLNPGAEGLAELLFDLHMEAGAWAEADQVLRVAHRRGALSEPEYNRRRALALLGRAEAARAADEAGQALDWALEARDRDPGCVPAVTLAVDLLTARGKARKAASLVKSAYKAAPHADLVAAWLNLAPDEAPLARVKRLQELVKLNPDACEGQIALAKAALDAQLWGLARTHLDKARVLRPGRDVFELLARVEREERRDEAAAQAWLLKIGTEARDATE